MLHGGAENGRLHVTYGQFVGAGVSRKDVHRALELGQALGLLSVIRSDDWIGDVRQPNAYRLTYVPESGKKAPTDEWSFIEKAEVDALIVEYQRSCRAASSAARDSPVPY